MMRKLILMLMLILAACTPTDTATSEPPVEVTETSEPAEEETDAPAQTLNFDPGNTVILIVDEFGMNFDMMSETVLNQESELLSGYIDRLINGDIVYDFELSQDELVDALENQEGDTQFSEFLDTYLGDEQLTATVQGVLEENITRINNEPMQASAAEATEEMTAETTVEAAGLNDQNCAVNPEGQSLFVTEGTSLFVTEGTSASVPGNSTFTSSGQSLFVTEGTNLFVTEGTNLFVTEGTVGASNPNNRPHGVRVREVAETLVEEYGDDLPIEIVNVPVEGYLMSNVAGAIEQAIQENGTEKHYVVNMSFAVIPCQNMETLLKYDALLRGVSNSDVDNRTDEQLVNSLDALLALIYSLTNSDVYTESPNAADALLTFTEENCGSDGCAEQSSRIVFVGAAGNGAILPDASGNYAATFPYYPAAWNPVISISASTDMTDFEVNEPRAIWSNPGLHLLPGIWGTGVTVEIPADSDGDAQEVEIVEVGTSFAAPRYSVLAALQLAGSQDTICGLDMQSDFRIPLSDSWLPNAPSPANIEVCP
jgi:hypothetical protein